MRRSRQGGEQQQTRRHPILKRVLTVIAVLVVIALAGTAFAAYRLQSNITAVDISDIVGTDRPETVATTDPATDLPPLNILLVGSDTRNGLQDADEFGGKSSITNVDHSDTTILLHVAADRKSAFAISIPRDSMVRRPDCKSSGSVAAPTSGSTSSASESTTTDSNETTSPSESTGATTSGTATMPIGMFNAAYDEGGIGCTVLTVEVNTGVFIDHYAVVNFEGFRDMVEALGGVDICLPEAIDDPTTDLQLPAGMNHMDGFTAAQYVRTRKSIGDGSDLGRIDRQQAFLAALIRQATDSQLLLRPDRLYNFLDAATKSVTMDPQMASISTLSDLAMQVQNIKPSDIAFITVPTEEYPPDHNRVQWLPSAAQLWTAARLDQPLPGTEAANTTTPTTAPVPTVSPAELTVHLINSSGKEGLAKQAGTVLTAQGFVVSGYDTGQVLIDGVVIRYPAGMSDEVATLQAAFPGARIEPSATLTDSYEVELGRGAPDVAAVPNRIGTATLPEQPIKAPAVEVIPQPTATPRVASDETCG